MRDERIVITKDEDFVSSFTVVGKPYKLLLVSTGNIKNTGLETLFERNIEQIARAFSQFDFIELDRDSLIFHQ